MYAVYCETCCERATTEDYRAANDFFMEHAESHHKVELLNARHADRD